MGVIYWHLLVRPFWAGPAFEYQICVTRVGRWVPIEETGITAGGEGGKPVSFNRREMDF